MVGTERSWQTRVGPHCDECAGQSGTTIKETLGEIPERATPRLTTYPQATHPPATGLAIGTGRRHRRRNGVQVRRFRRDDAACSDRRQLYGRRFGPDGARVKCRCVSGLHQGVSGRGQHLEYKSERGGHASMVGRRGQRRWQHHLRASGRVRVRAFLRRPFPGGAKGLF